MHYATKIKDPALPEQVQMLRIMRGMYGIALTNLEKVSFLFLPQIKNKQE
jgi:hypothetical protein